MGRISNLVDFVNFDPLIDRILVVGVGGGYDIYTCLPWYLSLTNEQKAACVLVNYSFSDDLCSYDKNNEGFAKIEPNAKTTRKNFNYFPELHLAKKLGSPVYAIRLFPCPQLIGVIENILIKENITKIFAFDGGIDSIILKAESTGELYGSPLEDSQMVIALNILSEKLKLESYLITSALGIDDCDIALYHQNWTQMKKLGGALGTFDATNQLKGWETYEDIVKTSDPPSIIQECINEAGNGKMGLFVNPRLYPLRIDDPKDFPLIIEETKRMWVWNLGLLVEHSEFYQYLISKLTKVDSNEVDNWIEWNQIINDYLFND